MALRLFNALTGRLEDFRPSSPPGLRLFWASPAAKPESLGEFRYSVFLTLLRQALAFLGCSVREALSSGIAEIYCGPENPPPGVRFWLRPWGPAEGPSLEEIRARSFGSCLRLWCLKTHYRSPLEFSWESLKEAQEDFMSLRGLAGSLAAYYGSQAPHAAGLAGYKKRLRDCLSSDLDSPGALSGLWDGLRPGALSPGSQLGLLREASGALGRSLLDGD